MEIPGPQGKIRECFSGSEDLMVERMSFLIWASTLSFDSLTCGVLKRWLTEGDEEGSSQLSPCSSRPLFFCISPAGETWAQSFRMCCSGQVLLAPPVYSSAIPTRSGLAYAQRS